MKLIPQSDLRSVHTSASILLLHSFMHSIIYIFMFLLLLRRQSWSFWDTNREVISRGRRRRNEFSILLLLLLLLFLLVNCVFSHSLFSFVFRFCFCFLDYFLVFVVFFLLLFCFQIRYAKLSNFTQSKYIYTHQQINNKHGNSIHQTYCYCYIVVIVVVDVKYFSSVFFPTIRQRYL